MKTRDPICTTMRTGHPDPNRDGDKRDIHDHNPNECLSAKHDRAKSDPKNDFQEGMNGSHYRGAVVSVAKDVLSSPMLGQRNSATGEYESQRNIEKP